MQTLTEFLKEKSDEKLFECMRTEVKNSCELKQQLAEISDQLRTIEK